ncbi:MAG TPA: GAF domain-containing protein, partial [Polyangiaceae bacterium]|nr:GAF domain-containing protein [Polyangiaceae bacterium]
MSGLPRARSRKVFVLHWIKRSVARQAGAIVAGSLSVAALFLWLFGRSAIAAALPVRVFMIGLGCVIPAAGLFAAWVTDRLVGSRLAYLVEVIDGAGPHDDLARIKNLGADEVGAIGHSVNSLLARITSIRASMIDQKRELGKAQRELELTARLAAKTEELSHRLEERAMLFELMRLISSSTERNEVLRVLVERVGQLLRLREAVIFLYDEALEEFAVQATYGFARKDALKGRTLKLGEGLSGKVGQTREPLVIADLSGQDGYLGFWGEAERSGSLAAVPILYRDSLLGVLTVTRTEQDPITDVHLKLLCAIADNAALALRNAQLFERMRELST